jgi:hypothetical protein
MSDESTSDLKAGVFVPQLFYDLIGRMVPGSILLLLGAHLLMGLEGAVKAITTVSKDGAAASTVLVLMALAISYSVGVLLGHLLPFWRHSEWKKEPSKIQVCVPDTDITDSGVAYVYDAIQHYYPAAGARLAKLAAELCFARVLGTGCAALAVVVPFVHPPNRYGMEIACDVLFLVVIVGASYVFHKHIQLRARYLMCSYWHLLRMEHAK